MTCKTQRVCEATPGSFVVGSMLSNRLRLPKIPPAVGTGESQETVFHLDLKPRKNRTFPSSSHAVNWHKTPINTVVTAGSIFGLLRLSVVGHDGTIVEAG